MGRTSRATFAVDVLVCPSCQGRMKLLAVVKNLVSIARYLAAGGELTDVPSRSPGRGPPYGKSRVLRRQALGDENQCGTTPARATRQRRSRSENAGCAAGGRSLRAATVWRAGRLRACFTYALTLEPPSYLPTLRELARNRIRVMTIATLLRTAESS